MEWGVKSNRVAMIALPYCGKIPLSNFQTFKPLKISRMFIHPVIKHYKEFWRVEDRARSGCLKSVRAESVIRTIREGICRIPL
jgi:hypothetical protein